jgi:hypothetical protein
MKSRLHQIQSNLIHFHVSLHFQCFHTSYDDVGFVTYARFFKQQVFKESLRWT